VINKQQSRYAMTGPETLAYVQFAALSISETGQLLTITQVTGPSTRSQCSKQISVERKCAKMADLYQTSFQISWLENGNSTKNHTKNSAKAKCYKILYQKAKYQNIISHHLKYHLKLKLMNRCKHRPKLVTFYTILAEKQTCIIQI